MCNIFFFFFSSRRRHTRWNCDWIRRVLFRSDPGGEDRAAQSARARVHHETGRREMVGEGVIDDVPAPEPRREERAAEAREIVSAPFQLVDRSGRGEDVDRLARSDRRKAAERRSLLLELPKLGLAQDGQSRESGTATDLPARNLLQQLRQRRRPLPSSFDLAGQLREKL